MNAGQEVVKITNNNEELQQSSLYVNLNSNGAQDDEWDWFVEVCLRESIVSKCRRDNFSVLKSSSISVKEGLSLPRRRSQRTLPKPATDKGRRDLSDMDREEESADTKTFDEYNPGEGYQPPTYLVFMFPAQVSFLNYLQ